MTKIITVYHGASDDFNNRFLEPRPSRYDNPPPFDFGLWVTTDYHEACEYLDPAEDEDEFADEIDDGGEIRVSKNRVITAELDITDAYWLESGDNEEALEAIANGKTILLNAEGSGGIFLTSTQGLRVTGEIR